ncbi:hypothetical protein VL04_17575 [Chromobacterium violaceum]|uniref:hypothetical protein n=1 Tax=Chromobacterium violaceum TaxID=536 RepID=UPI000653B097|nr:hypothetical protein [Chromobacterium violaceum]KMN48772.1 hypothetical protein VK93_14840 [Chromobacterium violaceum]KMN87867.1 hypothetical protein VL02_00835 [Chromobacterium violaceum]KMN89096.1 hypothetical protein VL04_17575 [Chromobacterium violaceum]KMO05470.1 hypothetical protein VL16_02820 [Chromobacterium violaceum]
MSDLQMAWTIVRETAPVVKYLKGSRDSYIEGIQTALKDSPNLSQIIEWLGENRDERCYDLRVYGWPVAMYIEYVRGGEWSGQLLDCQVRYILNPGEGRELIFGHRIDGNGRLSFPGTTPYGGNGYEAALALLAANVYKGPTCCND